MSRQQTSASDILAGAHVSRKLQAIAIAILAANDVPTVRGRQWKKFLGDTGAHDANPSTPLPRPIFANHITLKVEQTNDRYWLVATTKHDRLAVKEKTWERNLEVTCEKVGAKEWRFRFA